MSESHTFEQADTVYLSAAPWIPEPEPDSFWAEIVSGLLNLVCIIERHKLKREYTTADLRKAGKKALCRDE